MDFDLIFFAFDLNMTFTRDERSLSFTIRLRQIRKPSHSRMLLSTLSFLVLLLDLDLDFHGKTVGILGLLGVQMSRNGER